uniref:Uncharacterized protein n=1 Tax=Nelumbo nucifera TaxID=4432 RepID=A0A822YNZ2_NELNU|nr:TPA_asm: hypothetical protein HUJ06_009839 [Nelumbo nucifera]
MQFIQSNGFSLCAGSASPTATPEFNHTHLGSASPPSKITFVLAFIDHIHQRYESLPLGKISPHRIDLLSQATAKQFQQTGHPISLDNSPQIPTTLLWQKDKEQVIHILHPVTHGFGAEQQNIAISLILWEQSTQH